MLLVRPTPADGKVGRAHYWNRCRCLAPAAKRCSKHVLVGRHASLRRKRCDSRRSPFWLGGSATGLSAISDQAVSSGVPMVISIWALFLHKASYFSNHMRRPRGRPLLLTQCLIVALSGRTSVRRVCGTQISGRRPLRNADQGRRQVFSAGSSEGSPESRVKSSRTAAISFCRRGSWASMVAANRLSR